MYREGISRRTLAKAGGGSLLTLAAFGGTSVHKASAQDAASPVASPVAAGGLEGNWAAVRSRQLTGDVTPEEVLSTIATGYVPLLYDIDGFVAYLGAVDTATERSTFVVIFADRAGADESTARAGAWLQENGYTFFEGDPVVAEGPIGLAAGSLTGAVGDAATPGAADAATPIGGAGGAAGLDGTFVAVRSRTLVDAASGDALLELVREGFVPIVETVPGFIAYMVVANPENLNQFGIGIYTDEAGAAESTAQAAEWGAQGAAALTTGDPVVFEGTIGLAEVAGS